MLDKSGAAIVGAQVTLSSESQGLHRDTMTTNTGAYEFTTLTPGTYSLTVEMNGFRKYEHGNLELLVNAPATENVTLQIGSNTETVEVSAQAAAINTTDASLGVAFNNQQVKELPMESRNVPGLYFIGEVVDVTGHLGGFNFQWAWASGYCAGQVV